MPGEAARSGTSLFGGVVRSGGSLPGGVVRGERGVAAVGLVLLVALLLVLILTAVVAGGLVSARLEVDGAARQAARAAAAARDPAGAVSAARAAAEAVLASGRSGCGGPAVAGPDVGVGLFRPGGAVTVTVTCRVRLADVAMAHLPGGADLTSAFTAPIPSWRSR
ncbi:pilus assembly protein TadE [Planomonospora sp. ID91781]|uniref:pilus assembly protein n=1 Tax=Planomonospora sp. ID91781 TaxID=2738135 RepID=UPI0018C3C86C|nr:pilus assembly protein [Planomonospora sp. ID91781]MBG0819367.1 pilus assembly protein TadE [Planomonospora sp. ID91781]